MQTMTYVHGAERKITAARLTPKGVVVRFADEREGMIPMEELNLPGTPDRITISNSYQFEIHLVDGGEEVVPWDFARHFADEGYRKRSETAAARDRAVLGRWIRKRRSELKLTQQMLADRIGVDRVTIARIESGVHLPRFSTMEALAEGLDLPIEKLFTG